MANPGGSGHERQPRRPLPLQRDAYRGLGDEALIDAMRRDDPRAIDEFIIRAQRVLHDRAQWSELILNRCEDLIVDVIDDIGFLIVIGKARPSQSIAAYVAKVFRTRLAKLAEEDRRQVEYAREARTSVGDGRALTAVSEDSWRASRGADWDGALPISPALGEIAAFVEGGISEEERRILEWLSNYVSQRDICQWLSVSYAAGTQRIWRLRERLRRTARKHAEQIDGAESALRKFFGNKPPRAVGNQGRRRAGGGGDTEEPHHD